ncbi:unnamed protein product [Calypogeia fissa]
MQWQAVPEEFKDTKRAYPKWNEVDISKAFGLPKEGSKLLPRRDDRLKTFFTGKIDPRDGFGIDQCFDKDVKRVLEFLVPIFHPEKPKRVTVRLGSTIVASLRNQEKINWASIFIEVMQKQAGSLKQKKGISLSTYLHILYYSEKVLTKGEKSLFSTKETYAKYGIKDPEQKEESDGESEEESDPDIVEVTPKKKQKVVKSEPGEAEPGSGRDPESLPGTPAATRKTPLTENSAQPMRRIREDLCQIESRIVQLKDDLKEATGNTKKVDSLNRKIKELEEKVKGKILKRLQVDVELKKAKKSLANKEHLTHQVATYLEHLEAVMVVKGRDLVGEELYQRFLKAAEARPDATLVVRIVQDYADKVQTAMDDVEEAVKKL